MSVRRDMTGGDALTIALKGLDGLKGKTGYFETAVYPDGTPVALVATVNEFGDPTSNIPARPTMRPTAADKGKPGGEWAGLYAKGAKAALEGRIAPRDVLERLVLRAAGDVSASIAALTTPALAPETIARKGFAKPLVDSGQMLRSVTGVVE